MATKTTPGTGTVEGVLNFQTQGEDGVVLTVEIRGAQAPTPADVQKIGKILVSNAGLMGVSRG